MSRASWAASVAAMASDSSGPVRVEHDGPVTTVILHRPHARNAVDGPTAQALADAFRAFDADEDASVAVLYGEGGTFCAGADLKAIGTERGNQVHESAATARWARPGCGSASRCSPRSRGTPSPVGSSSRSGATSGSPPSDAMLGVFCRRWGVPAHRRRHGPAAEADRHRPGAGPGPHRA